MSVQLLDGEVLWAGIGSTSRTPWSPTFHATSDALDGKALCGAWVYEYAGRVGVDQVGAASRQPETNYDGTPMLYQVTCKRCRAKLDASAR